MQRRLAHVAQMDSFDREGVAQRRKVGPVVARSRRSCDAPARGTSTYFFDASHSLNFDHRRPPRHVANRDGDSLLLTDQHDPLLAPSDAGIEQISLWHGVVLRHDRDDHGRIFRALAVVDGRGHDPNPSPEALPNTREWVQPQ
jgi:hypothetical protein